MAEVQRASVQYPGGLAARYRWAGSGEGDAVFALSEAGGTLADHGSLAAEAPERACRAELRVEGPLGAWTVRLASTIFDQPEGLLWDGPSLLVVKYGFTAYAFVGRTGELRWYHACGTPIIAVLGSSRLDHVLVQGEVETVAIRTDGGVRRHEPGLVCCRESSNISIELFPRHTAWIDFTTGIVFLVTNEGFVFVQEFERTSVACHEREKPGRIRITHHLL